MTLKEELEILRGEPIQIFEGDPKDIPCIETSEAEKLCKNPLVSVLMTTYNHEPYIRRAIDGVMMQKTDFEFELIIGEDCSQDKTREICFQYQKKYPDKIRVLWWHENVSKLGGNSRRVMAHSRGEFVALCEGDDYWIDPLKLQKQVDYIKATNSVMCLANSEWHYPDGDVKPDIYKQERGMLSIGDLFGHYFHTTTYLLNRQVYMDCKKRYSEIIFWYDYAASVCMATMGPVCFLPDVMSVYNWTGRGMGGSPDSKKRNILIAEQFIQFSYCRNPQVAKHYTHRAIQYMLSYIVFMASGAGYMYSTEERKRVCGIAWRISRQKYGWFGVVRFLAYYCYRVVLSLRRRIPFIRRCCRK